MHQGRRRSVFQWPLYCQCLAAYAVLRSLTSSTMYTVYIWLQRVSEGGRGIFCHVEEGSCSSSTGAFMRVEVLGGERGSHMYRRTTYYTRAIGVKLLLTSGTGAYFS